VRGRARMLFCYVAHAMRGTYVSELCCMEQTSLTVEVRGFVVGCLVMGWQPNYNEFCLLILSLFYELYLRWE
jgi:hypothetical protein